MGNSIKFYLRRVRLDNSGYDSGGHYWGVDLPLFEYSRADGMPLPNGDDTDWIRAYDRQHAKDKIRVAVPDTTFFN